MRSNNTIFTRKDFNDFYKWINIDIDSTTWRGENLEEFEKFWFSFFVDGLSLRELALRFEFSIFESKVGPLSSWFTWLFEKMVCYTFLYKNVSIAQLSKESRLPPSRVSGILRNFFLAFYPNVEKELSSLFQIGHMVDPKVDTKYKDIKGKFSIKGPSVGSVKGDMMTFMEVTLYPEWKRLVEKLQGNFLNPEMDVQKIKSSITLKNQFSFVRDFGLLLVAGLAVIALVQQGNRIYEKYLRDKISIYGPELEGPEESPIGIDDRNDSLSDINLNVRDIEDVDDGGELFNTNKENQRFETESEVVLMSVDTLPRNFDAVERQGNEDSWAKSYRDSLYGKTKVYRVMMRSTDTLKSREVIDSMINAYGALPIDGGYLGKNVPGGVNYNVFVPRIHINEFLAQIEKIDQAVLYESRARNIKDEPGKDRVFIWVKSLN